MPIRPETREEDEKLREELRRVDPEKLKKAIKATLGPSPAEPHKKLPKGRYG